MSSSVCNKCHTRQSYHEQSLAIRHAWGTLHELFFRSTSISSTSESNLTSAISSLLVQDYDSADRSHLWYTLPWAFNEFVQLSIPDENINELEVFQPPLSSLMLSSSRLVRMNAICNEMSPILSRSSIMRTSKNCIYSLVIETSLPSPRSLPHLWSLHMVLYDLHMSADVR